MRLGGQANRHPDGKRTLSRDFKRRQGRPGTEEQGPEDGGPGDGPGVREIGDGSRHSGRPVNGPKRKALESRHRLEGGGRGRFEIEA